MQQSNSKNLRYVGILSLLISVAALILIPFTIISEGYLPPDDALRHAAKVISGKNWNEILIFRAGIVMDPHPGWHAILAAFNRIARTNADGLVVFSLVGLFLFVTITPIIYLERPEAWLAALLVMFLAIPVFLQRLILGRPYIFTITVTLIILGLLPKLNEKRISKGLFIFTAVLFALSTWVHGLWHMFILLILCLIFGGMRRAGLMVAIGASIGVFVGALLTGRPLTFLSQTFMHSINSLSDGRLARLLVTEFRPADGSVLLVVAVLILLLWRKAQGSWDTKRIHNPVFLLALVGWILGFKMQRFWFDWGAPAILLWIAQEFDETMKVTTDFFSLKRLALVIVLAAALFIMSTSDIDGRWTYGLSTEYLSSANNSHKEWLPEPGGILYAADMTIFYQTFFKNPNASWRYILGFEPSLMPEDDLATYRKIRFNFGKYEFYEPWVRKMGLKDRLVIRTRQGNPAKAIKELEWFYAAQDLWIGRLPRK